MATAILIFTKGGETNDIWFYEMQSDGRSLDDKRSPILNPDGSRDFGDLHLIIDAYKKRNPKKESDRTKQHFFIPRTEIEENDYDLSLSKYKIEIYEEMKFDEPKIILSKLKTNEQNILNAITELDSFIK